MGIVQILDIEKFISLRIKYEEIRNKRLGEIVMNSYPEFEESLPPSIQQDTDTCPADKYE